MKKFWTILCFFPSLTPAAQEQQPVTAAQAREAETAQKSETEVKKGVPAPTSVMTPSI